MCLVQWVLHENIRVLISKFVLCVNSEPLADRLHRDRLLADFSTLGADVIEVRVVCGGGVVGVVVGEGLGVVLCCAVLFCAVLCCGGYDGSAVVCQCLGVVCVLLPGVFDCRVMY